MCVCVGANRSPVQLLLSHPQSLHHRAVRFLQAQRVNWKHNGAIRAQTLSNTRAQTQQPTQTENLHHLLLLVKHHKKLCFAYSHCEDCYATDK